MTLAKVPRNKQRPSLHYLDITLPGAAENLALDEALLLDAEDGDGGEILRLWEYPDLVSVLGAGCKLHEDVDEEACRVEGVPILRRASGGGTVLWGQGCLLFTLVLRIDRAPELARIDASYHWILSRLIDGLSDLGVHAQIEGISDLAIAGRKFSGNAQQRKRDYLLHHGTLLYAFNLDDVSRFLRAPPRQPQYREGRHHDAFLCNLLLSKDALTQLLREIWDAAVAAESWPEERVRRLTEEKYAREEWTRRR